MNKMNKMHLDLVLNLNYLKGQVLKSFEGINRAGHLRF